MSLSMYQASVPGFVRGLENLAAILTKAETDAATRKIDPAVLVNARLAPDMYPLSRQIQIATDVVKGCAARLGGVDVPSYEDNETTFADLQARIAKTLSFIQSVKAAQIDGSEERKVTIKMRGREVDFSGQPYLLAFVIPNFYFHITTAYNILRHNGVELGKPDYIGSF